MDLTAAARRCLFLVLLCPLAFAEPKAPPPDGAEKADSRTTYLWSA